MRKVTAVITMRLPCNFWTAGDREADVAIERSGQKQPPSGLGLNFGCPGGELDSPFVLDETMPVIGTLGLPGI
jgi:hypothetical protein